METNKRSSMVPRLVGGLVVVLVCCASLFIIGAVALIIRTSQQLPANVPDLATLIPPIGGPATALPTVELDRTPVDATAGTLETLENTLVPENDPYDLACRLQGKCNISQTVQAKPYRLGDQEKFWILNSDTAEHTQITATLRYITPHTYFWAQDGVKVDEGDVKALMDTFESKIYPTNREFFGSEWTPGVDGDPHIYVIYAGGLGSGIAGYFNSTDSFNPLIREYSNGHESYVFSTSQDLAAEYTYAVLAHEFVHMIQFPSDRNDATWITEGFADVGILINGYKLGNHDRAYVKKPDLQLTDWGDEPGSNGLHYGQAFLYLAYFLDRFGEDATKALTNNPENDLVSVDDTLADLNITDPQTGALITADDVFMDWAATLYLMDESVGDGRYTYHNYPAAPQYQPREFITSCPKSFGSSVNQYGIDYYTINCTGDHTIRFTGSTAAQLLPVDPHSDSYAFWSNKGNESLMTLGREFDLTGVSAPIELSYWMWYDIETDWDYLHVTASTDGQNWEIITTPSGTPDNPSGNSYGWGYTGKTGNWKQEQIDLSQYAGQKVQIRFEYVTDAAVNGEGFLLDDVRVDAVNYQSDFEADDGGWQADGFVRVENVLPQTYRLSLIIKGADTTVTHIPLSADQTADIPFSLNRGEEAILIVTGTTRFTTHPAAYQIEVK